MAGIQPEDDFVRDPNHFMKLYTGCHSMSTFLTEAIVFDDAGGGDVVSSGDYV